MHFFFDPYDKADVCAPRISDFIAATSPAAHSKDMR